MRLPEERAAEPGAGDVSPYEPEVGSLPEATGVDEGADELKTGTTTVGLTTADGVVIATDMRASLAGRFVANKNVQKVEQVHPRAALTMVGSVGGAQSFIRTLRAEADLYEARRGEEISIEALMTLAGNLARGGPFFRIQPILGGVDEEGHHVAPIYPDGGVTKDDYVVTGSGMQLAYGVLEQEYGDDMSNDEATAVAARAVQSAAERDTGSGDGVYLAEITDEGVDIHGHTAFDEVI
jgi:proteasome beta subunit